MKEDVVAANLANLRDSINELKECIEKQSSTALKPEQSAKVDCSFYSHYLGMGGCSFCQQPEI